MEKKQGGFYRWIYRELAIVAAAALAVVMAVSSIVYAVAEEKIKQSVFDKTELETRYFIRDLDRHFEEAEGIGNQIVSNLILSGIMSRKFQLTSYASIEAIKSVQQFQQAILNNVSYIKDVKIYELYNGICISNSTIETLNAETLKNLQKYSREFSRKWLDPGASCLIGTDIQNSKLLLSACGYNQKFRCIVVVEMNNDWIYRQVEEENLGRSSSVGILGFDGRKIYNEEFLDLITEKSGAAFIKGRIIRKVQGERYLVTEEKSGINDWVYVSAVPESAIMPEILQIRKIIAGIMVFFGMLMFGGMMYAARHLIEQMSGLKNLQSQLDRIDSQIGVKNNLKMLDYHIGTFTRELNRSYMLRLLQGNYSGDDWQFFTEKLNMAFSHYLCMAVDLKLDGKTHKSVLGFQERVRKRVVYGAERLLSIILKESGSEYNTYILEDIRQSRVYVLLGFQKQLVHLDAIKIKIHFYQNVLLQTLQCISVVGMGKIVDSPADICVSKEQAEQLVKNGVLLESGNQLYCAEQKIKEMSYSEYTRFRTQLKSELLKANAAEVESILRSRKEKLQEYCKSLGYFYCSRDVLDVIYEVSMVREIANREYYNRLAAYFSDMEEYFQNLDEYLDTVAEQMAAAVLLQKEEPVSEMVQQAVKVLGENYQRDISLQFVADELNVSASYLSRRFKEEMGVGFKEYLTGLKMKKAKEWMKSSEMPLKEIAVCVGYSDYKQFNTIFKKQYGISAGEYRKTLQKFDAGGAE